MWLRAVLGNLNLRAAPLCGILDGTRDPDFVAGGHERKSDRVFIVLSCPGFFGTVSNEFSIMADERVSSPSTSPANSQMHKCILMRISRSLLEAGRIGASKRIRNGQGRICAIQELDGREDELGLADILKIVDHRIADAEAHMLGIAGAVGRLRYSPVTEI